MAQGNPDSQGDHSTASPGPRKGGLAFIFFTLLLDVMGIGVIIPILPQLVLQFQGNDHAKAAAQIGLQLGAYTLMQFLLAPMLGAWSDRVGRKPVLLLSLVGTSASYLLAAMAPDGLWLFASRVLAGAFGASLAVGTTYIADVSPPQDRSKNFGLLGAAFGVGFILGPAFGGVLSTINLRLPFYAAAALALANALYGLLVVPESLAPENRSDFSWKRANPISALGALGMNPVVSGFAISIFLSGLAQQSSQANWVVYTTYRFHWTPAQNALSMTAIGIVAAVVQGGLIRVLMPRLGERRAILLGGTIGICAFAGYGLATQGWMMIAILVCGGLASIAGPAMQGLVSQSVGPRHQGKVQGAMTSLMSLAGIIAPVGANAAFAQFTSPQVPIQVPGIAFLLGAALLAASLVNSLRVMRKLPASPVEAPGLGGGGPELALGEG